MKRKFHDYRNWEEFKAGMWRKVQGSERQVLLEKAIEFTGDAKLYGKWMLRVIEEWPISCEQHLGHNGLNRQAWVGHAAVCLAFGCPEDITREAWWKLTEEQQSKANEAADRAISKWEQKVSAEKTQMILFEGS